MTKVEEILKELGIKCSLGTYEYDGKYHAICYTRKQGETWVRKLEAAGYKAGIDYDNYAYMVVFVKK